MRRIIGRMTVVLAVLATTAAGGPAGAGPSGGALPPVLIEALQIGGEHGIPPDAAMVAATVTSIDPTENGWIKAFPCDAEPPDTANLNYATDQIANNLVLARLSADGRLCIATRSLTDYVVDVAGYVPAGSTITPLPSPVRTLDTRDGTGGSNPSPVPDGGTVELQLAGEHDIPTAARLAIFNLTAVGGPVGGRITAHPCDEPPGTTSSVNFPAGRNVANLVVSRLSGDGTVCFLAKNASDMVVDLAGYAAEGITTLPTPRRVLDTRSGGGLLDAESSVTVEPNLPADATAAVYNLTAVDAPSRGFATAHPCDEDRPTSSNLNFAGPQAVGAGSITKLDGARTFCLFTKSPVNLIVDLIGYTTDAQTYVPMTPIRIKDTRQGWESTCPWVVGRRPLFDGILAYNLRTDQTLELEVPDGGSPPYGPNPIVDQDCTGAFAIGDVVHHFGFDGSYTSNEIPDIEGDAWAVPINYGTLHLLPNGAVGLLTERMVDTSTRLRSGPDFPSWLDGRDASAKDIAIDRSGSTIAIIYASVVDADRSWLIVYDGESGDVLSDTSIPADVATVDISPDGRYVVVDTFARQTDRIGYSLVYTIFGDLVDGAAGSAVIPAAVFVGPGQLLAWVSGVGLFHWDLHGRIERFADTSHPFAGVFGPTLNQ